MSYSTIPRAFVAMSHFNLGTAAGQEPPPCLHRRCFSTVVRMRAGARADDDLTARRAGGELEYRIEIRQHPGERGGVAGLRSEVAGVRGGVENRG